MVLVPEGKTRFFFFSVQRPQSLFFFPVGFCLLCFTVSVTLLLCFFFQVVVLRGRQVVPCCSDCFAGGGGRWRCSGSRMAAPSSGETRLFTPLGISFCFLFSSLSSLFPFYTPYSSSLKFPPLFQTSPFFSLPPFQFQKSPLPSKKILLSSVFFRFPLSMYCCVGCYLQSQVSGASYRCAWEQGKRRLVGHWVLLSRFDSNGMGPRVEEQCQNDTVQILFFFFFFYYYYYIYFFYLWGPKNGLQQVQCNKKKQRIKKIR